MTSPAAVPFGDVKTPQEVRGRRGYGALAVGLTLPTVTYVSLRVFERVGSFTDTEQDWDAWRLVMGLSRVLSYALAAVGVFVLLKHVVPAALAQRHRRLLGLTVVSAFSAVFAHFLDGFAILMLLSFVIHTLTGLEFLRLSSSLLESRGKANWVTRRAIPLLLIDALFHLAFFAQMVVATYLAELQVVFFASEVVGFILAVVIIYTAFRTYLALGEPFVEDVGSSTVA